MLIFQFKTLGETGCEVAAVSDDDQNSVCLPVNVEQHSGHYLGGFLIEVAGGFIAQKQSGLHNQRAREGHALFLTAGQLTRVVIEPLTQTDLLQKFSRTV
jgi:acyl-CoA thioesterase-1